MQTLELKPWRNGLLNELLLILPQESTWQELQGRIDARLDETRTSFFGRGAQLTLDFGSRAVSFAELEELTYRLKTKYSLLAVAVVSTHAMTQEAARQLVLNTYLMLPGSSLEPVNVAEAPGNNALYIQSTVRSGQRIVHDGHVIVGGDINAGAEVIAAGDIIVFGTLRGLAHAGSQGNEAARIFANNMRPQQIRIASQIARSPEEAGQAGPITRLPEVARIFEGTIQVFPL